MKEPFEAFPGIVVPPDTYRNTKIAWRWNTNRSAWIALAGSLDYGGFLSGDRRSVGSTIELRKGSKPGSSLGWHYNDIDLREGSFITNLGQWRFNYSFTPLIYIQSLVQYNDRADLWTLNLRSSWLNTAGTGLFIVYNET